MHFAQAISDVKLEAAAPASVKAQQHESLHSFAPQLESTETNMLISDNAGHSKTNVILDIVMFCDQFVIFKMTRVLP